MKTNLYFATIPACNYLINVVLHGRFSGLYIPKCIYIETTNRCNAHCIMCPHDKMTRPRGHMAWDVFTGIIDQCAEFEGRGLKVFLHKDGEPLMDPLLFDRIAYAKARLKRSILHFNTNAALLTEEKSDLLLDSCLDSIVFSVDGASRDTYEKIRRGLDYDTTVANVNRFLEKQSQRGRGPKVMMQMVVDNTNKHEMALYREQWEAKVAEIVFKPMHNFLVQDTAVKGGKLESQQLKRCTMPFHLMLVYQNGDLGLCCWDYDRIMPLGNVADDHLLTLFNSAKFEKVRKSMKDKDCVDIEPCNKCSQIYGHDGPMWR